MDSATVEYFDNAPPPKPAPAPIGPPPGPFPNTEWLNSVVQQAVREGVMGSKGQNKLPAHHLMAVANDREFLYNLQKVLEAKGVTELDPLGANDLPRQGSFKTTFSAGDNVLKFGGVGEAEWEKLALPEGVWGVEPLKESFDFRPIRGEDDPNLHDGLSVYLQRQTERYHPIWGTPQDKFHHKTLSSALKKQGWEWHDDHKQNFAFLKGDEYRPVVIDGEVMPYERVISGKNPGDPTIRGVTAFPFTPPTKPDWYYSVLLPLLMGGEEENTLKQPPGLLSGLTESY
jgi:hypothetical protein